MSTAAPAAAGPAPAPAAPASPDASPQTAAPAAPPKPIKPIPPPRLPGVIEDGPEDASSPEAQASRARDAQGRFVAAGEPKSGDTVPKPQPRAVDAPDGEPKIPDLPDAKPKIKFAGREYDDLTAIEREYKGQMERLKPVQQKAAEYEGQLIKAAESARGWQAEALRLKSELDAMRTQAPAPEQKPETPAGIDWDVYAEISRMATEAGTPWKAQQWLQEQYDTQIRAEIARVREEALTPYRQEQETRAAEAHRAQVADTLVDSMAAHTNPDGSPAFPEFLDGEQARAVGELWRSLGLDPEMALTPGGAVAAVALYRMARGMDQAAASPTPAPAAPPPPDPAALAAAGLEDGRPVLPSAADRRSLDPGIARLVAGLKNTQLIRPGLGFEA